MIAQAERERIIALIQREVVPAIGCTEPVAVALCVAKAFERLFRKYARSMQLVALGLYREQLWQKMLFRKVLCICGIIGKR